MTYSARSFFSRAAPLLRPRPRLRPTKTRSPTRCERAPRRRKAARAAPETNCVVEGTGGWAPGARGVRAVKVCPA